MGSDAEEAGVAGEDVGAAPRSKRELEADEETDVGPPRPPPGAADESDEEEEPTAGPAPPPAKRKKACPRQARLRRLIPTAASRALLPTGARRSHCCSERASTCNLAPPSLLGR